MCQTFLSKTFANSLSMQKNTKKCVGSKNNDAYSLMIRVQTRINHIRMFFTTMSTSKKMILSECELKEALNDTLMQAA